MNAPRLDRMKVWTPQKVRFWALVIDGRTEVGEFFHEMGTRDPEALVQWMKQLDRIGQQDHWAGEHLFRRLKGYPDQWEVRRGDHRLLGFRVGDDVILCLHRVKHRQLTDPRDLERVARLAKEWRTEHGDRLDR